MPNRIQPLQTFHINMLKKMPPLSNSSTFNNVYSLSIKAVREENEQVEQYQPGPQGEAQLDLDHMEEEKRKELLKILILVGETPGHTEVIHHHITLMDLKPICQPVGPRAPATSAKEGARGTVEFGMSHFSERWNPEVLFGFQEGECCQ